MNNLDRKPFKNDFAGKSAKTKQHFKPNSNLSGYGKGTDVTVKTNKLALPVTRTGSSTGKLVKRTYADAAPGLQGGLRETMGVLEEINNFCSPSLQEGVHPLNSLFVRIRHAQKTGDKAEAQLAISELETKARRYNLMKDPEVLEFLN